MYRVWGFGVLVGFMLRVGALLGLGSVGLWFACRV